MWERRDAIDAVTLLLDATEAGRGGAVFVRGDAGMGKSSILAVARAAAAERFAIGVGHAAPIESAVPFDVVAQALTGIGAGDVLTEEVVDAAASQGYRVWRRLRVLQDRPVLLLFDDLHWADPDSLTMLSFLSRRLAGARVAVIATLRPWPRSALDVAEELRASGDATIVELAPLSARASGELLVQAAGRPLCDADIRTMYERCAGNPLLLQYSARLLSDDGTEPHGGDLVRRELLVHRFAGASAAAVDCARAGSVLGLRFHPADAAQLAHLSAADGADGVDGLHRGRVLRALPDGLVEFAHPVFRQVVYDDLPAATRLRLHAAAFALLAGRGAEAAAAEHAILGRLDGDPAAIAVLARVGARAAAVGATRTAARCLTGAYRLAGDRADPALAVAAADALLSIGQPADAVALLASLPDGETHHAAAVVTSGTMTPARAREAAAIARTLGRAYSHAGNPERAAAWFRRAVDLARDAAPDIAVEALLDHATARNLADGVHALPIAVQARDLAAGLPAAFRRRADSVYGYLAFIGGDIAGFELVAAAAADIAADPALHVSDVSWTWGTLSSHAFAAKWAERFDESARAFDLVMSTAERAGAFGTLAVLHVSYAELMIRTGRLAQASASMAQAAALADPTPMLRRYIATGTTWLSLFTGDLEEVARHCGELDDGADEATHTGLLITTWYVRGRLALHQGEIEQACRLFDRIAAAVDRLGIVEPCVVPWGRDGIDAYVRAGRRADAVAVLARLEAAAVHLPCRWPRGAAAVGQALLAEDHADADRWWTQALTHHDTTHLPLERVETLLGYGSRLRRDGRLTEARSLLGEALAIAENCGAQWLAGRATDELRLAGGRRRRDSAAVLTPAEQRVADLAAAGLSNAAIASRLNIAVHTVESHLGRVYTKLGVTRRGLMTTCSQLNG